VFALNIAAKEESDRDFHFARFGGEGWITVSYPPLLMGTGPYGESALKKELRPQRLEFFSLRWRAYIGTDIGEFSETGALPANARSNVWLFGRVTTQLSFPLWNIR
jgi:hypothetical protein